MEDSDLEFLLEKIELMERINEESRGAGINPAVVLEEIKNDVKTIIECRQ